MASAGAVVNRSGVCAASPQPRIRASGVNPSRRTAAADAKTTAAAPSLTPDAFPAVTVPPCFWNAGCNLASAAGSPPLAKFSSAVTRTGGAPFFPGTDTGAISAAQKPAAAAALARAYDVAACSSCAARLTLCSLSEETRVNCGPESDHGTSRQPAPQKPHNPHLEHVSAHAPMCLLPYGSHKPS